MYVVLNLNLFSSI